MYLLNSITWQTIAFILISSGCAQAEGNEFLKYNEPKSQISLLGNIDSLLYMITVFALILGLAYATSRFLGTKFSSQPRGLNNSDSVLSSLPLGPNRGIYLVHFAGRLLVLGVSEHKIELLSDMTDAPNASELRTSYTSGVHPPVAPQFSDVFSAQVSSLRQMTQKFPRVFGQYSEDTVKSDYDREKR